MTQAISIEAVETSLFNGRVSLHPFSPGWSTSCIPTSRERFADASVDKRERFGDGYVIVWGGIAHGVKSQLNGVEGNMTEEATRLRSPAPLQQRQLILQQENAQPKVAC